ncbi:hypothetical protein D3C77_592120 [compost metagenome]
MHQFARLLLICTQQNRLIAARVQGNRVGFMLLTARHNQLITLQSCPLVRFERSWDERVCQQRIERVVGSHQEHQCIDTRRVGVHVCGDIDIDLPLQLTHKVLCTHRSVQRQLVRDRFGNMLQVEHAVGPTLVTDEYTRFDQHLSKRALCRRLDQLATKGNQGQRHGNTKFRRDVIRC